MSWLNFCISGIILFHKQISPLFFRKIQTSVTEIEFSRLNTKPPSFLKKIVGGIVGKTGFAMFDLFLKEDPNFETTFVIALFL